MQSTETNSLGSPFVVFIHVVGFDMRCKLVNISWLGSNIFFAVYWDLKVFLCWITSCVYDAYF